MSGPTLAWYCSTVMEAHKRLSYLWDISSVKRMNQTHVAFGHTFHRDSLNLIFASDNAESSYDTGIISHNILDYSVKVV